MRFSSTTPSCAPPTSSSGRMIVGAPRPPRSPRARTSRHARHISAVTKRRWPTSVARRPIARNGRSSCLSGSRRISCAALTPTRASKAWCPSTPNRPPLRPRQPRRSPLRPPGPAFRRAPRTRVRTPLSAVGGAKNGPLPRHPRRRTPSTRLSTLSPHRPITRARSMRWFSIRPRGVITCSQRSVSPGPPEGGSPDPGPALAGRGPGRGFDG